MSSSSSSGRDEQILQDQQDQHDRPSSYEVDEADQNSEQHLGSSSVDSVDSDATEEDELTTKVNGDRDDAATTASFSASSQRHHRYGQLLDEVGIAADQVPHIASHLGNNQNRRRPVYARDIFCNRELKVDAIAAIGFDMDYTLARYQQPAFDQLAFDGAVQKLVNNLGYPRQVLDFQYDHNWWTRGLIIDTIRGNFLKIDRHKYVRVAYHGFDKISSTTRKHLYAKTFNKVMSFSEKSYVNMDTLFQFVDAHLYACLIRLKDHGVDDNSDNDVVSSEDDDETTIAAETTDNSFLDYKTYEEMYKDVRECIDLCHRDGVIKDTVAADPARYIVHDPDLIPMIRQYRDQPQSSGGEGGDDEQQRKKKVFLLTNSYWEYTSTVMNYLYHGEHVSDDIQQRNEWLQLFDLVVVGSCKPAYMIDPYLNLFRVLGTTTKKNDDANQQQQQQQISGTLQNTDGIYEIHALGENGASKFLEAGKTFQGGNWIHLHAMLGIQAGEEILYVGDHLYSDVLRTKRTLGWRSAFIVPELEEEMSVFYSHLQQLQQIIGLRKLRDELSVLQEHILQQQQRQHDKEDANGDTDGTADDSTTLQQLQQLQDEDAVIKSKLSVLADRWHAAFHPVWGK